MAGRANRNVIDGDLVVSGTIHTQSVNAPGIAKVVTESAGTTEDVRRIEVETIPGVQASADEKSKTWIQASAPTIGSRPNAINGDYWVDSDDSNRTYVARAGAWVEERASTAADTANTIASKASQAQNGGSDGSAFTATPAVPTIGVAAVKRGVVISIPKQANLLNPAGYRVQISVDNSTWYCPNIAASTDSDDYKTGAANGYLAVSDETLTLGFLPIPLVDGVPQSAGRLYYFRAARVGATVSGYTTPAVSATVKPTTNADMAALAVRTAQVDLANYIKARNPNAALDGLECLLSMEDVPACPTNPQGREWLFKDFVSADGWGPNDTPSSSFSQGIWRITGATYSAGYYRSLAGVGRLRVRVRVLSGYGYIGWDDTRQLVNAGDWTIIEQPRASSAYCTLYVNGSMEVEFVYVGDGSYTPLIPDNVEGHVYRSNFVVEKANWNAWNTCSLALSGGCLAIASSGSDPYFRYDCGNEILGKKLYVRVLSPYALEFAPLVFHNSYSAYVASTLISSETRPDGSIVYAYQLPASVPTGTVSCIRFDCTNTTSGQVANVSDVCIGDGTFSGDYHDQSGKGREVRYYGVVPCEGIAGSGLRLENENYAQLASAITTRCVAFWEKSSNTASRIVFNGPGSYLAFNSGGVLDRIEAALTNGASFLYPQVSGGCLSDGNWHFYVVVLTDSVLTVWRDGVAVGTSSGSYSGYNLSVQTLGRYGSNGHPLNGVLDEFRIYSRALTIDEIAYLHSNPSGPIPAMFGAHRIVADSITAREMAADSGIFAKIKTSNLDVDAYGSIVRLNAGAVYWGKGAVASAPTVGPWVIPSPSPYAGQYALGYLDLETGKIRVGSTSKFLCWDGTDLNVIGNFKLGGAGSYFENSDGKIRITPDATPNNFGEGLVFCTRALASAIQAGDVRLSTNTYDTSPYKGSIREMRIATGATPAYSDTIYIREQMVFTGSGLEARHLLYTKCSGDQYTSGARFANPDGAIIADKAYQSTTRYTEWVLDANDAAPTAKLNIYGAGEAYAVFSFTPFGTTSTTYMNWFQPSGNEMGYVFYSDVAAGGSTNGYGVYARNNGSAIYTHLGGTQCATYSGNYIQVKAANASYKMVATRVRMI